MTAPLISVCMASYNHAPFVRFAVESVLGQSFTDWELVITDDGSSDGTLAALAGLEDGRVHVEGFPENRSACVALNHCIRRARGRFIAVLNSDDAWAPGKLAAQLAAFEERPRTAAVFTHAAMIDEHGQALSGRHRLGRLFRQPNRNRDDWLRRLLVNGNCLCHPSVLVRAEVYRDVGLYDERLAQLPDLDMWIRICLRHDIWVIPQKLTMFRLLDRERNASGNRPDVRVRCAAEHLLICRKVFRERADQAAALLQATGNGARTGPAMTTADTLRSLLDDSRDDTMPPGLRIAQLLWMYEHLEDAGWQDCKRFIAKTGDYDPFGMLERESLRAELKRKRSWWERLLGRRRH